MNIILNPLKIFKLLLLFFIILLISHLAVIAILDNTHLIYNIFHFNVEKNLPTLYSTFNLFLSSLLLMIISRSKKNDKKSNTSWSILSFIFLFLALDEGVAIHERLNSVIRNYVDGVGTLYSLWMLPYSILVLLFIAAYLRFWISLPGKYRKLFLISGFLYVGGAMGMSMIGSTYGVLNGTDNLVFNLFTIIEESMEMLGIIVFNFSLFSYLIDFLNEEINIKISV